MLAFSETINDMEEVNLYLPRQGRSKKEFSATESSWANLKIKTELSHKYFHEIKI